MHRAIAGMAVMAYGLTAQEPARRVEIGPPTVVTVRAEVCPENSVERRKPSRMKRAGLKILAGAGTIAGWLLNVNDDIPPARDRSTKKLY